MSKRPWNPLPEETDLFCNVYVDESSWTKFRYFVLGGLVVPLSHAALFEADIVAARQKTILPACRADGTPRVMKWENVYSSNFDAYTTVIDTAFRFRAVRNLPARKEMGLHCVVVDTSQKPLRETGDGDREVGFDIEFHFLCTVTIPKRYRNELFHVYPDRRHAKRKLWKTREIMNKGSAKWADPRLFPVRRLRFEDPEACQALQVVDILIGALAYRLNRHYEKPDANRAKKELCDHIWKLFKLGDAFSTSHFQQKRFMTWMHRPEPLNSPKSGPQHW